jgi:V-type H+-transporting ATPase subunit a
LNPEENLFSREYVSEVRRAEEMLRRLRYLEKEIEAADVAIPNRNLDYDAPMPGEIGDLEVFIQDSCA